MIQDPYAVLGVSQNATPEEVKKAYRKKVKQYHPDLHPGDEEAARKMNEINEAYDMITNPEKYRRQSPGGNPYSGGQPGGGAYYGTGGFEWVNFEDIFGGFYRMQASTDASDTPTMAGAVRMVNGGRPDAAMNILNGISAAERNARWYYVAAVASYNMRSTANAVSFIREAVTRDPNNLTYRRTMEAMQSAGNTYRQTRTTVQGGSSAICERLCLAYCIGQFCCGGRFFCC